MMRSGASTWTSKGYGGSPNPVALLRELFVARFKRWTNAVPSRSKIIYPVAFEDPIVDGVAYYASGSSPTSLLILASGGDNALSALATGHFDAVTAVDLNSSQIYQTRLKSAVVKALDYEEALGLFATGNVGARKLKTAFP